MEKYNISPEDRRKALFAATHHHDGVMDRAEHGNGSIRIAMNTPDVDETREFVKTVGHALGFTFSSEGPFVLIARPKF